MPIPSIAPRPTVLADVFNRKTACAWGTANDSNKHNNNHKMATNWTGGRIGG